MNLSQMFMSHSPLAMMNRHGLIAGATGTGKTKTLQVLAEQLSANGVPVFMADVKGDLSGIAAPRRRWVKRGRAPPTPPNSSLSAVKEPVFLFVPPLNHSVQFCSLE